MASPLRQVLRSNILVLSLTSPYIQGTDKLCQLYLATHLESVLLIKTHCWGEWIGGWTECAIRVWMDDRGHSPCEGTETTTKELFSEFRSGWNKRGWGRKAMGNWVRKIGTVHLMPGLYGKRSESYPKCFRKPLKVLQKGMTFSDLYFKKTLPGPCRGWIRGKQEIGRKAKWRRF